MRLPVDDLAVAAVTAALEAAADLAEARGAGRPQVAVDPDHVAASFRSERYARVRGEPAGAGFAPLSRLVRCRDGWARTHGNYPHHAAALTRALRIEPSVEALEAAAARLDAVALEDVVVAAGGCAAALRTPPRGPARPGGRAAAQSPLIADDDVSTRPPRPIAPTEDPARPAAGLRVLDLTRVIAGPVAGRTLAALGADVLRVDPPQLPELPEAHLDTGPGKRAATLDLADAERRDALLARADIVLM